MKLQRLLAITMLLLSRRRMSGQELADRFEVSLRTIYRDLETINSAGIPVASYAGADGGYEIMDQYRIERQMVTFDDLQSIVTALKGMQASLDDRGIDDLLAKVGALVAKSEQNRQEEAGGTLLFELDPWGSRPMDKATMNRLREAAKSRNVVRFDYSSPQGDEAVRTVEPIGLAWKGYAWYLFAYCRLREDYRTFKLSRIGNLQVDSEVFRHRGVRLEELNTRWRRRSEAPASITIKLRFHPRVRGRVEEYFARQPLIIEEDGSVLVTASFPEDAWLYGMLLSYGANVKVLEPKHIADGIKEQAEQIARQYT